MVAMFYVKDQHRDTVLAVPAEIVEAARISAESRADMVTKSTTEVIGGGSLVLPFDDLSPYDFERLCLTLVKREGYQQVEHLGATGRPHQGRDIVARRDGDIWAFQCKRMRHFHLTDALSEIESVLSLSEDERPAILVFVTSGDVSARTREEVRTRCAGELMECRFWTKDELEERVSRHPDIVEEFFPSKATLYYTPFQAPPLPSHFVSRPELSEALKTDLLTDEVTTTEPVVVNAVLGMGGVGKSTLAAVLAHDAEVQARFPDGVLWATVGQQPNILSLLMNWIQALEDYDFQPPTIEAASVRLRTLLHDRACLLVLDDVRQSQHVRPFLVDSSRSQILITTRGVTVASQEVGSRIYEMGVMTPEQSLGLLAEHLGRSLDEGEQEKALRLAQAVDYHPLTLQLAAAQINQGASWTEVIYNMQSEMEKHQPREHISHMGSKGMVHVSAGPFLYGDDKQELNVREFWIDRTPVTNAEYARFIAATGHEPPNHWTGGKLPQEIADHPVTQVSWYDAMAYADWAGKRLPTEEEWEKTARGTEGQIYPWGEEPPTSGGCNFGNNVGTTTPVGRYSPQGDSPYGCSDMAGNVWEWTSSSYDTEGDRKVLRGGCWDNEPLHVRSAYRISNTPESRGSVMGFRCVKDSE
jgi:formylglycine-generating enzyme required for sulfatase activity